MDTKPKDTKPKEPKPLDPKDAMDYFLDLSVVLTGFSRFHLQGTGQASLYFQTVEKVIGKELFSELLKTFHKIHLEDKNTPQNKAINSEEESILTKGLRLEILGSEKFGPIARNIIKLWYLATWFKLPQYWRNDFGNKVNDETFVPSPEAYPEGLVWPAVGVSPRAAKPFGYGSWSEEPLVSLSQG